MISYMKDPSDYAQELYDLDISFAQWAEAYPSLADTQYGDDLQDAMERLVAHAEWWASYRMASDDPTGQDLDDFLYHN